jgi:hypothetical protein
VFQINIMHLFVVTLQKHAPTAVDPKRAYGSVPESFSSGAFLRVRLEERSIVEARNAEAARKKEEAARK